MGCLRLCLQPTDIFGICFYWVRTSSSAIDSHRTESRVPKGWRESAAIRDPSGSGSFSMCNCGTSKCACGISQVEQTKGKFPRGNYCGTMPVSRSQLSWWRGVGKCRVQPSELHTPPMKRWGSALGSGQVSTYPCPTLNNSKCVHYQFINYTRWLLQQSDKNFLWSLALGFQKDNRLCSRS